MISKIRTVTQSQSLAVERVAYAAQWIYAHMLHKNNKDPYQQRELEGKDGKLAQLNFHAQHLEHLISTHHVIFDVPATVSVEKRSDAVAKMELLKKCVVDPLLNYQTFEGPPKQTTLLTTISQAANLLMKHAIDLRNDVYRPEIKGHLSENRSKAVLSSSSF